jgi:hypothetical protein
MSEAKYQCRQANTSTVAAQTIVKEVVVAAVVV